ncbi:hypothetical protein INT48_004285 [Thamnidium elegans]|uniref:Leucine-rich repeat and WD repeat-containing protein 1 WD domain-containing protein n=1 Tax=Thamnidium elegans TaxID=101142 RepID=A0A8H7VWM5_9FUNG|nr:hypothetical protein INT48_004285 [Thamnidium elegans]
MGYLYSRMLASSNDPTPVKPKKKVAKPKVPKPTVPKPTVPKPAVQRPVVQRPTVPDPTVQRPTVQRPTVPTIPRPEVPSPALSNPTIPKPAAPKSAVPNPTVYNTTTVKTIPKQARPDNAHVRSQPTGSNQHIVIPSPVNFIYSPSARPISSPHIPERTPPKSIINVERNISAPTPNKIISDTPNATLSTTFSTTYASGQTSIAKTVPTTKSAMALESKGAPAKRAKMNVDKTGQRGKKRTIETDDEEESLQRKEPKTRRHQQPLPILSGTYKLSLVFKGHTDINIPAKDVNDDDFEDAKDIWCCEFEPTRPNQVENTNVVAICGSYTVLLLDTLQARYTKKYTHTEVQEIFYCMAWTTLSGPQLLNDSLIEDQSCNVLAIAGRLGSIKLLNPLQNECYRYLFGHEKAVLKMIFAKSEPRWLFTASADKTVRLWDIGSPTSKDDDSVTPSALSISYDLSTLMVGFDNGDMASFHISPEQLNKFRQNLGEYRHKEAKTGDKWAAFGPLATITVDTMYPKGSEWHEGYIDDICIFGQDGNTSSKLYNKIISRGADDMEFIIWDREKSTKTDADILLSLEWPDSAGCTGSRYKVIEAEGQKVLIAGEYDGQVCIYNVGEMKKSKTLADNSVEQFKPTKILSHSMSSELIRDVCCSNDTRTIVAVDNNNTVFVWNCTE